MVFIQIIKTLIAEIEPESALLMAAGILLITASFLHAFYPPFIVIGSVMCAASVVLRVNGGGDIAQVFVMVFFALLVITAAFFLVIRASKYGWIIREPDTGAQDTD